MRLSYQLRKADRTLSSEIDAAFQAPESSPLSSPAGGDSETLADVATGQPAATGPTPRPELVFFDPAFLRFFGDELHERRSDLFSRLEQRRPAPTETAILGFSESGHHSSWSSAVNHLLDGPGTSVLIFHEIEDFHRTLESLTGTR